MLQVKEYCDVEYTTPGAVQLPEIALDPDHPVDPPDALHMPALVEDHVTTGIAPVVADAGETEILHAGWVVADTVTVAGDPVHCVVPTALVHDNPYCFVAVMGASDTLDPLIG